MTTKILVFHPKLDQSRANAAMIRAAHTLCGIHRTGGFPLVAGLAKTIELTLAACWMPSGWFCSFQCNGTHRRRN